MTQGRKINWLKTTILVLLACGVAGLGLTLALFFGNAAPTYASATLVFSFDGAADGIAPNGVAFDVRDITLDEVISEGLKAASLEGKYTPEQIRSDLVVSGVYPDDMAEQVMHYESLLNFTANRELTIGDYHPTTFNIQLYNGFDKSLSKEQLSSLLRSILDAYRARFAKVYAFGLDTNNARFALDDYDYPQQLQIIEEQLDTMSAYALELYDHDPAFRLNGAGFNDISVRLNTLIDSNISRLNAELTINALTKDPARLLTQYQFEIRSLNNQLDKQTQELAKLDKLIDSYEKNEIIYLSTTDALTKIDGNSSETYDTLIARRKSVADGITEINYQIATYKLLLSDLVTEETSEPEQTASQQSDGETVTGEEGAASAETVAAMTEEELAAAAAEAEQLTNARREQLEARINALLSESDAVLSDFKAMIEAYNSEKINDTTVTVTEYKAFSPSLLSGSFIKTAIKTAGPIVVLGFMVCAVLIIISRKKEEKLAS